MCTCSFFLSQTSQTLKDISVETVNPSSYYAFGKRLSILFIQNRGTILSVYFIMIVLNVYTSDTPFLSSGHNEDV